MADPITITLSTGETMTVQQPPLIRLHLNGQIPDLCTPIVLDVIKRREIAMGLRDADEAPADLPADAGSARKFLKLIVCLAAVDPIVTDDLNKLRPYMDAGIRALHVTELSSSDVGQLYAIAVGDAAHALALFRCIGSARPTVGTAPDRHDDEHTAERPVGDTDEPDVAAVASEPRGEPVRHLGHKHTARNKRAHAQAHLEPVSGAPV